MIKGISKEIQIRLVDLVEASGRKGITVASLSKQTGVLIPDLRDFLANHKRYFCRIGNSKYYRLNPFGEIKGNKERIITEIERAELKGSDLSLKGFMF